VTATYAISVPSDDQSGEAPPSCVSFIRFEPSTLITNISSRPSRSELNAILELSGDHAGEVSRPNSLTSDVNPVPSVFIIQMFMSFWDHVANASFLPSGDHA
jgi:hypothetical protein